MTTAQRVIRPYAGLDGFEEIVSQFRLRVGSDVVVDAGRSTHLDSFDFLQAKVTLELAESDELWAMTRLGLARQTENAGLEAAQVALVIVVSTSYLKMSDVVFQFPLTVLDPTERTIPLTTPSRPRALRAAHHGASVEAFVCLIDEVPPQPLRPSRFGTYLARAQFRLSTDFDAIGFRPRPLTAADRASLGLPAGTVRYLDVPVSPLEDIRADDVVEMWVDADLLGQLSLGSKTAASRAFQVQLFLDAVGAIAERARGEIQPGATLDDLEETFVGRMIMAIAGSASSAASGQQLLDLMRDSPGRFMAYVEARSGIAKELNKVVGDGA